MLSRPYITITFLVILQISPGYFLPLSRKSFKKDVGVPQCDSTCESMFSKVRSVTLFTNAFLEAVYSTEILRETFDVSEMSPKEYADNIRRYTLKAVRQTGVDKETAQAVAEFAARAIAPSLEVMSLPVVACAYANMAANFLFVDRYLDMHNAEDLALVYAQSIVDSAEYQMTSDPTSKFLSHAEGFVNFFRSLGLFTKIKSPLIGYYVGNEWLLAAVNYKYL